MSNLGTISIKILCLLFTACGADTEITPEPATEENVKRLELYVKPNYELREVYQHPLGETDDKVLKSEGLVVAGLIYGNGVEGLPVVVYMEPGGRFASLTRSPYLDTGPVSKTYGSFPNAKALASFVQENAER